MRTLFLLLALCFWGTLATAQQGKKVPPPKVEQEVVALPKTGVNWLFIAGLAVVVVGAAYFIMRSQRVPQSGRGMGSRRSSGKTRMPDKPQRAGKAFGFYRRTAQAAAVEDAVDTLPQAQPEAAPQAIEKAIEEEITPSPTEPVAVVETLLSGPEIFYMTVPGADGRFGAGARKTQPSGCLYRFEVLEDKPEEALLFFSGNEDDMRNAQAFRDLELLPACTFSGTPDAGSFRFAQKPGRAHFDGTAWAVQQKVEITFI